MANLTVGQANDIGTVIRYLGRLGQSADPAEHKHFGDALLRLRSAMQAKLMAGPLEDETRGAIAAVEQLRAMRSAEANRCQEMHLVYGRCWNYLGHDGDHHITIVDDAEAGEEYDRTWPSAGGTDA